MNERKLRYVCPICGRKGVFGRHVCSRDDRPRDPYADLRPGAGGSGSEERFASRRRASLLAGSVFLSACLVAFAWQAAGRYALVFLALPPLLILAPAVAGRLRRRPSAAYLRLLLMVHNDRRTADRLVRAERARDPGLSPEACAARALETLEYERGR